ncbi:hypothetical protein [Vibrio hibernica]|uniref:hypothetical protein n=1 Tax=Vibrio hibernica TaxID=2587465 RepID=UPI00188115F6|nr:hypothetical protein [Vibrio hibernica]
MPKSRYKIKTGSNITNHSLNVDHPPFGLIKWLFKNGKKRNKGREEDLGFGVSLHLTIDADTHEIIAAGLTFLNISNGEAYAVIKALNKLTGLDTPKIY